MIYAATQQKNTVCGKTIPLNINAVIPNPVNLHKPPKNNALFEPYLSKYIPPRTEKNAPKFPHVPIKVNCSCVKFNRSFNVCEYKGKQYNAPDETMTNCDKINVNHFEAKYFWLFICTKLLIEVFVVGVVVVVGVCICDDEDMFNTVADVARTEETVPGYCCLLRARKTAACVVMFLLLLILLLLKIFTRTHSFSIESVSFNRTSRACAAAEVVVLSVCSYCFSLS